MLAKLSYMSKPGLKPFIYETVPHRLAVLAQEQPDREAFIYYDKQMKRSSMTRKQLWDQSLIVAKQLMVLGVKKGTPVAFCMANSLEMLVLTMGVSLAGGIALFINSIMKDGSDIVETMNFLKGEFLFIDAEYGDDNWKLLNGIWPDDEITCKSVQSLRKIIFNGKGNDKDCINRISVADLMEKECSMDQELPEVFPEDVLAYFCTSGSTGKPKIVIYTHFCTINWTIALDDAAGFHGDSIWFCDRTFSWVVGYPRTYLAEGMTRVFIDTRMATSGKQAADICTIIDDENCDVVFLPGYLASDITNLSSEHHNKLSKVRTVITAGERVSSSLAATLMANICRRILVLYGATEIGCAAYFISESTESYEDGIIGIPYNGVEVKLINESGQVVPYGCNGELVVRCSWRCSGYEKMPDVFHRSLDDSGWFHTGDIAHFRQDGNLVVNGRFQERLSIGTTKVFPWAVENVLKKLPGVSKAFAVGVPDPRYKQAICACVQVKQDVTLTADDVMKFCEERFLGESGMGITLCPKHCLIFEKIPLTPSGKIDRRQIGFIASARLNL